jgi:predicted metal-dependent HD superfamily phosphohydrolase
MLQSTFTDLAKKYTDQPETITTVWNEIANNHSHSKRFYHNLTHLEHLLTQLTPIQNQIKDWDAILFALYFHDVVYNVTKHKNEEMSSEWAGKKLNLLKVPVEVVKKTRRTITATKKHELNDDPDINYFTDADLSILGTSPEAYKTYTQQIRKEYAIYPDVLYKPGRKKVLEHFLEMERIFKTNHFFELYETQARENLQEELQLY